MITRLMRLWPWLRRRQARLHIQASLAHARAFALERAQTTRRRIILEQHGDSWWVRET